MKNRYASIPTQYNGINFRSRLEARWATLFDLLEWEWEYEPIDFNGWIPDFTIKGEQDLFVEIKPFTISSIPWDVVTRYLNDDLSGEEISQEWLPAIKKIVRARPNMDTLLLGSGIYHYDESYDLGVVICKDLAWATTVSLADSTPTAIVQSDVPPYIDINNAWATKRRAVVRYPLLPLEYVLNLWKEAGNRTQWKRPEQL